MLQHHEACTTHSEKLDATSAQSAISVRRCENVVHAALTCMLGSARAIGRVLAYMACVPTKIILNNGVELPRIGLGTYRSTGASVTAAVTCAWNSGIEHIDTASVYKVTLTS